MAWLYLLFAGVLEIGWPVGLKMAQAPSTRVSGIVIALLFMAASGFLLWTAQKQIPIGTAYAVWTGIGAAGTVIVGMIWFGEPATFVRMLLILGLIGCVAGLKMTAGH